MPKIIAHRGVFDNQNIMENTLDSFQKAIQFNYSIELDVQLTTDNKIVVFHDDNLNRLTKRDDLVQEMDSSEITRMKLLHTKQKIPYLKDVLELNRDRVLLDIEIKHTKRIKDTVFYLMKELENYHNYVIISFDPRIIRYLKKNYPFVETGLLLQSKYPSFFKQWFFHTKFILKYSMCDFISISKKLFRNEKMMKKFKDYHKVVWTMKNIDEIDYQDDVTYVCNNLPYEKEEKTQKKEG